MELSKRRINLLNNPVDFIRDFLKYVNKEGIYDEFDASTQKMVTSAGLKKLIQEAQHCLPEKIGNLEAANRMRNLTDAERDKLIADADEERIVDLRRVFHERMSTNRGAHGLIEQLVKAMDNGDGKALDDALMDAIALVKGPENV